MHRRRSTKPATRITDTVAIAFFAVGLGLAVAALVVSGWLDKALFDSQPDVPARIPLSLLAAGAVALVAGLAIRFAPRRRSKHRRRSDGTTRGKSDEKAAGV